MFTLLKKDDSTREDNRSAFDQFLTVVAGSEDRLLKDFSELKDMKILLAAAILLFHSFSSIAQQNHDTTAVYFAFDKAALTAEEKSKLEALVTAFRSASKAELVIKGFCDPLGTDQYNDILSDRRTMSVQQYLLQNDIPLSAISLRKGYGEREPVNENRTREERQANRRVDVILITPLTTVAATPVPSSPKEFSKERLDSIQKGDVLRLKNINFYGGRHTFLPESMPALDELLEAMVTHPNLQIEIQGHICCLWGPDDGDDYDAGDRNLSRNRAKAVYDYLAEKGIDKARMSYKGFAGTVPLVYPERTEEDRTTNRRVEIKIVSK
jgi:outer membrane protein OmpA-like peptidoglycan-associated protein